MAYNWSTTAPHRFNKQVLDRLIGDYKPGNFGYGTIMMYAKQAGWDEAAWQKEIDDWDRDNAWRDRMSDQEKGYKWIAKVSRDEKDAYYGRLKEKYTKEIAAENSPATNAIPQAPLHGKLLTVKELKALPRQDYLVKGIIPATGISACYGASGSGKTFLITDLGINLSLGFNWYGIKVKQCPVTIVVLEGSGELSRRIETWEKHFKSNVPDSFKVFINSFALTNASDVAQLISEINKQGQNKGLLIIDTLSQASPGADENSSKDMGLIIQSSQHLARETGNHVMLVHHTGKDAGKGLRGHSSLMAALDVAIEVKRDGSARTWNITKAKDSTDNVQHSFKLERVVLGTDSDGDEISSCVITTDITSLVRIKEKEPKGAQQKIALTTLKSLLRVQNSHPNGVSRGIELEAFVKAVGDNLAVDAKRKPERARAAINGMLGTNLLSLKDGYINIT